jgi:hypothetical protein
MDQIITQIPAIALVFLTFILAKHTKSLALEATRTRKQQTEPHVIVTAVHDFDRPSIIMLVITNIGNGLASNISFNCSGPILQAYGISEDTNEKPTPIISGPLVTGIPNLGPGEKRMLNWGQFGGLKKAYGGQGLTIECSFHHGDILLPTVICKVDIESFEGTVANEGTLIRGVKALESIARNI